MSSFREDYGDSASSLALQQRLLQPRLTNDMRNSADDKERPLLEAHGQDESKSNTMSTIKSKEEKDSCFTNEAENSQLDDKVPKRSTLINLHDKVDSLYQEMVDILIEAKNGGLCDSLIDVTKFSDERNVSTSSGESNANCASKNLLKKEPSHRKRSMLQYDPYEVSSSVGTMGERSHSSNTTQDNNNPSQTQQNATKQDTTHHTKKRVSWSNPNSDEVHRGREDSSTIFQSFSNDSSSQQFHHKPKSTNYSNAFLNEKEKPCLDQRRDSILEFLDNERAALAWSKETQSLNHVPKNGIISASEKDIHETKEERRDSSYDHFDLECAELASSERKLREELLAVNQNSIAFNFDSLYDQDNSSLSYTFLESNMSVTKEERRNTLLRITDKEHATTGLLSGDKNEKTGNQNAAHTSSVEGSKESNNSTKNQRCCSLLGYLGYDNFENNADNDNCSAVRKSQRSTVSGSRWKHWFTRKFLRKLFLKPWSILSHLFGRFLCFNLSSR